MAWLKGLLTRGLDVGLSLLGGLLGAWMLDLIRARPLPPSEAALMHSLLDGVCLLDRHNRITDVNTIFEKSTGWSFSDVYHNSALDYLHPDDKALGAATLEKAQAGERPRPVELRVRLKQGGWLQTRILLSPRRNRQGDLVGVIAIARDVTPLYRQQDALQEIKDRYNRLAEQALDAIVVVQDNEVVYLNPAATRLLKTDGKVPFPAQYLFPHVESLADSLSLNKLRCLDGSWVDVEAFTVLVTYGGRPAQQVLLRDVTERHRAQQREFDLAVERERSRVLHNFISDASHDLRTPISSIRLGLYLVQKYLDQPAKLQETLGSMRDRLAHLEHLLEDLLNMSRLDNPSLVSLERVPWQLDHFVSQLVQRWYYSAQQHEVTLRFVPDDEPKPVQLAAEEFRQALDQLLENALIYSEPGGTVTLSTQRQPGALLLRIEDSGMGIPANDLPFIFNRFFRGDKARSAEAGRTGLGLSIVKRIIELHEGKIVIESAPGQGTRVQVTLPLSPAAPTLKNSAAAPDAPAQSHPHLAADNPQRD